MSGQFYGRYVPSKAAAPKKPSPPPPSPAAEPKKRKRESHVEEAVEDTPKKHKSILSKFEKAAKLAQRRREEPEEDEQEEQENVSPQELHDLNPLPQPDPVPEPVFEPTFSILPAWLENPSVVEASKSIPFAQLGVQPFFLKKLEKRGYKNALAVQSALLPMLHPGYDQHLGDICVSARTGSGKTLAYLLPIIEALKDRTPTTLSAIIVVPSRKLVDQALQVAEELCAGTTVKVGAAVGSAPFATEQKRLVKATPLYGPERAAELHKRATENWNSGEDLVGILDDISTMPVHHYPEYESGVDILVCTPGRLVEHIESTTGFLLRSVRWLVIDEADQLLNQEFQGWANVLMDALYKETPDDLKNAQEKFRKQSRRSGWAAALPPKRQTTKIVLSATMESDLNKLGSLRLRRPKFVAVHDEPRGQHSLANEGDVYELPSTLAEFAIPVKDGAKKPLYLLYLLLKHIFGADAQQQVELDKSSDSSDSSDSSSSESSSEAESDEESDAGVQQTKTSSIADHKSRVLIFTKNNENASRLSRLLLHLEPSLTGFLEAMTPSSTAKASKKLLRAFSSGDIKILIASDAASRGLDIPDLTHVVNYDIPNSVTSYVHRVGRTARADKPGEAWTFFTKTEAAWFWNDVARSNTLRRGDKVMRVVLKQRDVEFNRRNDYEEALKKLQDAVEGNAEVVE